MLLGNDQLRNLAIQLNLARMHIRIKKCTYAITLHNFKSFTYLSHPILAYLFSSLTLKYRVCTIRLYRVICLYSCQIYRIDPNQAAAM